MDIDQVMNKHDLSSSLKDTRLEDLRKNLARSVIDEYWKPDWAMIEADYLSEKISCNDLAKRYVPELLPAIRAKVTHILLSQAGGTEASSAMIESNVEHFAKQVTDIMAKRITRMQGAGNWTAKRRGRQMRVVAEVVEERIESDIESIKAMREVERADIERMRVAAMSFLDEVVAEGGQQFLFKSEQQDTKANGLEAVSRIYEKIQKMLYKSWDIAEKVETLNKNINSDLSEMPDDVLLAKAQEAAS